MSTLEQAFLVGSIELVHVLRLFVCGTLLLVLTVGTLCVGVSERDRVSSEGGYCKCKLIKIPTCKCLRLQAKSGWK